MPMDYSRVCAKLEETLEKEIQKPITTATQLAVVSDLIRAIKNTKKLTRMEWEKEAKTAPSYPYNKRSALYQAMDDYEEACAAKRHYEAAKAAGATEKAELYRVTMEGNLESALSQLNLFIHEIKASATTAEERSIVQKYL